MNFGTPCTVDLEYKELGYKVKKKVKVLPRPLRAYTAGAHLRFQWPRASGRQSLNAQDTWLVCRRAHRLTPSWKAGTYFPTRKLLDR